MANKESFESWAADLDAMLWREVGIGLYDLPDCDLRAMYEDGASLGEALVEIMDEYQLEFVEELEY